MDGTTRVRTAGPGAIDEVVVAASGNRALRVLVASGRACSLHGAGAPAVVVPLSGCVTLSENESTRVLRAGRLFLGDGASPLGVIGSAGSLAVTLVAPPGTWRQLVDAISDQPIPGPLLLPATHAADRSVRRAVAHLARIARGGAAPREADGAVLRLVALLLDLQATLDPLVARCPGRTLGQRRGVLLRLQRVRNLMESCSEAGLGIAGLARVASYSPSHFLRTFNAVYGTTPHSVLVEQRLARARRLVDTTALSIAEVARASGFENRCAFARSFKRRFGETASAVREGRSAAVCG